jgi:hypothetical protein
MALDDPSGQAWVYVDTSTCTYSPCTDSTTPLSDTDSNGSFNYCPNDTPDASDDGDQTDDIVFTSGDTDYMDELDDAANNTFTADTTPTKIYIRHVRIYIRHRNKAFWRHIRNLYNQGNAAEAVQEMLDFLAKHPPQHPLPSTDSP